jgi:hypothetical protein
VAYVYAISGKSGKARAALNSAFSPYLIAKIHAGLGEKDEAFVWLEKAYEERDERMVMLKVDPHVDSLRRDPRFQDLLRRMHLASQ